jgi:hypothetical protein
VHESYLQSSFGREQLKSQLGDLLEYNSEGENNSKDPLPQKNSEWRKLEREII